MKHIMTGAVLALIATPVLAQQAGTAIRSVDQARPAVDPARPVVDRASPRPRTDTSNNAPYIAAWRKANQRAKNAVANGANPARVRAKLQAYKKQLRRRYNATH